MRPLTEAEKDDLWEDVFVYWLNEGYTDEEAEIITEHDLELWRVPT